MTLEHRVTTLEANACYHDKQHEQLQMIIANKFDGVYKQMEVNRNEVREELRIGNKRFDEVNTSLTRIETTLEEHCKQNGYSNGSKPGARFFLTPKQLLLIIILIIGMAGSETLFDALVHLIQST